MLGEQIGEDLGQVTSQRVLSVAAGVPRVETSFQAEGTFLGVHAHDMGTYEGTRRADGSFEGQGCGVLQTEHGDIATWTGVGVGRQTRPGAMEWRGSLIYTSSDPALARLNGLCCVFEFDADETGKVEGRVYEWK